MTRHKRISYLKSVLRIVGGALTVIILPSDVRVAVAVLTLFFMLAELLGIVEESEE